MSANLPDDDRTVIKPVTDKTQRIAPPAAAPKEQHHNALPVGTYLGEFELTDVVGEGGFGIVYVAWDHSLERRVALKEYMPSALAQHTGGTQVSVKSERHRETFEAGLKSFVNEARLLAQFDHHSLVKVYRFWEANGTAYMVMPLYEGPTLKDALKTMGQPPDEEWLLNMLDPLSEALEVLHNEQCFHRDIAPDNVILLKGNGRPLLLDFGAARRVIGDMTQALTVILKPGYAPVEQYAEVPGMKQGAWTDVYALSAMVYYAISGKTPPPSVGRLLNDNFVPLSQLANGRYSERFLKAIDHGLAVKPEDRTQSIAQLRNELGLDDASARPAPNNRTVAIPGLGGAAGGAANGGAVNSGAHGRQGQTAQTAPGAQASGTTAATAGGKPVALWAGVGVTALALIGAGAWWALKPASTATSAAVASSAASSAVALNAPAPQAAMPVAPINPVATPSPAASGMQDATTAPAQSATTTATTTTTAPGPFDPLREFDRVVAAQTPGFTVEAAPAKPVFRIGKDRLGFTVRSAREGYVYVLLVGTEGAFMQLFPNNMGKNNRIRAGEELKLPQASWPMDVAGPAGTDHFLVIVSAAKRDFKSAGMKMDGGFGEFQRAVAEAAAQSHTGPGSAFAGQTACADPGACSSDYGAVVFTSDETN